MNAVKKDLAREQMNRLGKAGSAFLFIIDFLMEEPVVIEAEAIDREEILFEIPGGGNAGKAPVLNGEVRFSKRPVSYSEYAEAFSAVRRHFLLGNTFLTNLTFPTPVDINLSLKEIFHFSRAKYKLLYRDRFVVFSPEIFVRVNNGMISSYPMKGTIDASVPHAEKVILSDEKEMAEHITIVDLIRNDIGIIAEQVRVAKFRYIDRLTTNQKDLLQVSSEIRGRLPHDYRNYIGDILFAMLPAGSITGAPKKKTVEIILEAETYRRGYYTGVFGYFDGHNLDSAVMIRFIEKQPEGFVFKSGGGLTVYSNCKSEYQEYVDKVYVPIY
jgi:para-aminobenzoate synthetase component I